MEAVRVGIREFRDKLASYLLESDAPMAITRHGDTVGYYIPARRKRSEASRNTHAGNVDRQGHLGGRTPRRLQKMARGKPQVRSQKAEIAQFFAKDPLFLRRAVFARPNPEFVRPHADFNRISD